MRKTNSGDKRKRNKIIVGTLTIFQVLCILGAFVLNDLSHKSVGVNHHVVFRKHQYMHTILDAVHMDIYRSFVAVILVLIVLFLMRHPKRKSFQVLSPLVLFTLAIGFVLSLPMFMELPAYIYIIFLTGMVWVIELIKAIGKLLQMKQI